MWRTGCGERTLEGAEAVVFAEALLSLLDEAVERSACPQQVPQMVMF